MNALEALHGRGAHFVIVGPDKRPIGRGWQKTRPRFAAVEAHEGRGGLVGVIPGSLGCVVVDVDRGGQGGVDAVVRACGAPLTIAGTRGGGSHLWYRAPVGEVGNRKWALGTPSYGGDIRGSNGFVVLWDPVTVVDGLAANFTAGQPPSLDALPKPATNGKRGPEAVRDAPVGARNDTLNREAFLAAKRGDLDEGAFRDAGAAAGLPPGEVEATLASAARAGAEKAPRVVPAPSSPMAVARALTEALFTSADGALTLRHHRGDFYRWDGCYWPAMAREDVRAGVYLWLEHAVYETEEGPKPFDPARRKIDDVIDALRAVVLLNSKVDAPCWTDGTASPPAEEVMSLANGLLHIPARTLRPHTPGFFNHHSLAFPYQPACGPPARWLAFLDELWGNDQQSIDVLQETFGYILGGDTGQQKMFLLVGPRPASCAQSSEQHPLPPRAAGSDPR